jgi:2-polyprenyl-6-methoxyphenol hydroxylase-like FAD-dependent oxidoreductase
MPRIIVMGGGFIGLATALMLAKQGHEVTVMERDPQPPPETPQQAWDSWERPGVMQFRQPHFLLARGRQLLDEHLPEVISALVKAGAVSFSTLANMPQTITDRAPRPGDERFTTFAVRRPLLEYAMAAAAEGVVDVRRGARITGLLSDGNRRVTGVTVHDGELKADLVIDAMGRRSPLPAWLSAIGAGVPAEESEDLGFVYYTRYFRPAAGQDPPRLDAVGAWHFDCYSLLTLPGDAGTWSIAIIITSRDSALKALREEANWTRLVSACPVHAPMLAGEPIGTVAPVAGIADRLRRLVDGGAPTATGVLTVGDSWSCTNPSLGRGMTFGLMHAAITAEVVAEHLADPLALALAHDRLTRERLMPWYQATAQTDRQRVAQIAAVIEGRPAAPVTDPAAVTMRNLMVARALDPDIFRVFLELIFVLALPQEIMARPGLAERVRQLAEGRPPTLPPGPSRAELLRMLS